jgi:hypothetical protein
MVSFCYFTPAVVYSSKNILDKIYNIITLQLNIVSNVLMSTSFVSISAYAVSSRCKASAYRGDKNNKARNIEKKETHGRH